MNHELYKITEIERIGETFYHDVEYPHMLRNERNSKSILKYAVGTYLMTPQQKDPLYIVKEVLHNNSKIRLGDSINLSETNHAYTFWMTVNHISYNGRELIINHTYPLSQVKRVRKTETSSKVLFTTEDGFKIHEGDTVYRVAKNYQIKKLVIKPNNRISLAWFKYYGNANKFVNENKPLFSLNDIRNARKQATNGTRGEVMEILTKLAYERIK